MPIANPLFRAQCTDGDELGPPHLEARQQGNLIPPPPFLSEIGCLGKLSRQLLLPLLPLKQILDFAQNWKATGEVPCHSYVSLEHISSYLRSSSGHSHMTSTLRWGGSLVQKHTSLLIGCVSVTCDKGKGLKMPKKQKKSSSGC